MKWITGSIVALGALVAGLGIGSLPVQAQNDPPPGQREVASKTEQFKTVTKTDRPYRDAAPATDLNVGLKLVGKPAVFRGTVVKLFEPDGLLILNFAKDYRTAITAVLRKRDFSAFPDMGSLLDREILIHGIVSTHQGRPQIELTKPEQIRLVK